MVVVTCEIDSGNGTARVSVKTTIALNFDMMRAIEVIDRLLFTIIARMAGVGKQVKYRWPLLCCG